MKSEESFAQIMFHFKPNQFASKHKQNESIDIGKLTEMEHNINIDNLHIKEKIEEVLTIAINSNFS